MAQLSLLGDQAILNPMKNVLLLTHEPLTDTLAGGAIRAWELAHALARQQSVTLGTPNTSSLSSSKVRIQCFGNGALPAMLAEHEVVIVPWSTLPKHPIISQRARYLVLDMYDPYFLTDLYMHSRWSMSDRANNHQYHLRLMLGHLARADFFLCASERQRDFWLGALAIANRINPYTYESDPTLQRLLEIVPFGLPGQPPKPSRHAIKGVVPGIGPHDVVILWGGGIWDWLDPLTAIEAVAAVKNTCPTVRLYFMGLRHPNPDIGEVAMAQRAMQLAKDLGLLGRQVFFRDGWVPYLERANYLCDADIAISLQRQHLETRLSFRTRILDYFWAGLPVISTVGDVLSDDIERAGAGVTVPEKDVGAVASAVRMLVQDPGQLAAIRRRVQLLAANYRWQVVATPLLAYCREPWQAADADRRELLHPRLGNRRLMWRRLVQVLRRRGLRATADRAHQWLGGRLEVVGSRSAPREDPLTQRPGSRE
jgi:glycosyltransferase involved in cell wall biosynthesis